MESTVVQLAIVLALASLAGFLAFTSRLPLMIGYLLAGVALSAFTLPDVPLLETLPEVGIALVLFLIGMEMNWGEIRLLGKPVAISAVLQIIISSSVGYFIARTVGFVGAEALFVGIGLAFASTIVIVKMLLEKREITSLYGKLSVGILIVEDIVAILALMAITLQGSGNGLDAGIAAIGLLALKAAGLILFAYLCERFILERIFEAAARSIELLFFTAIAWCFIVAAISAELGFSVVIGAFIAGMALASSPYQLQIQGKVKPLRDFFVAIFFVYIGSQVAIGNVLSAWPAVLLFAAFAVAIKPLIYLVLLGFFGFRRHTLFQSAINMSQISEFSLILLLVGAGVGVISPLALSIVAAASTLSIIFSSILIENSARLFGLFEPFIRWVQKTEGVRSDSAKEHELTDHVVLIGAGRAGRTIVRHLEEARIPFIALDYDPLVVHELSAEGARVIYGDLGDPEMIENLALESARLIISTAPNFHDNQMLLEACRKKSVNALIVVRVAEPEHEQPLRDLGADYVILPEKIFGDFLVSKLKTDWPHLGLHGSR